MTPVKADNSEHRFCVRLTGGMNHLLSFQERYTSDSVFFQSDVNTVILSPNYRYKYSPHISWETGVELKFFIIEEKAFAAIGISFTRRALTTKRTDESYAAPGYENIERFTYWSNNLEIPISVGWNFGQLGVNTGISFPFNGQSTAEAHYDDGSSKIIKSIGYTWKDLLQEQRSYHLNAGIHYLFTMEKLHFGPYAYLDFDTKKIFYLHYGICCEF